MDLYKQYTFRKILHYNGVKILQALDKFDYKITIIVQWFKGDSKTWVYNLYWFIQNKYFDTKL